ncbi:hypothetical protein [Arthrobacter sp. NPDC090010]|uniref:hypothetical protein n=1 Tax=Arthrobacter sp. NPDC090010 TaxID=3363942 RepID=UPI0038261F3C
MKFRAGCAVLVLAVLACVANPVQAADGFVPVPQTGSPGRLELASAPYPLVFPSLAPGQEYSWQLRLSVAEKVSATTSLRLSASGALAAPGGYLVTVRECSQPWDGGSGVGARLSCAGKSSVRIDGKPLDAVEPRTRIPLAGLPVGQESYLAVSLAAPRGMAPAPGESLRLGLGITAQAEDGAPGQLGSTGYDGGRFALLGGALLLLGTALWAAFARRRPAQEKRPMTKG